MMFITRQPWKNSDPCKCFGQFPCLWQQVNNRLPNQLPIPSMKRIIEKTFMTKQTDAHPEASS